jgi:hypothetical protein
MKKQHHRKYWPNEIVTNTVLAFYCFFRNPLSLQFFVCSFLTFPLLLHNNNQQVIDMYKAENLKSSPSLRSKEIVVSDVPYTKKFGNNASMTTTMASYIKQIQARGVHGSPNYPWYLFEGYGISTAESSKSHTKWKDCPTPDLIQFGFEKMVPNNTVGPWGVNDASSRNIFAAVQWGVGQLGSGAPVHFHNAAWNALIYGAKYWVLYPPHDRVQSNTQINEFIRDGARESMKKKGAREISCVHTAGDILIVPESWGHGVLNLQDSVALATEVGASIWRKSTSALVIKTLRPYNLVRS